MTANPPEVRYSCLECPICYFPYSLDVAERVPVSLPCAHHFCRGCARQLCRYHVAECPYDRSFHLVRNADFLPRCHAIQSLLEDMAAEEARARAPPPVAPPPAAPALQPHVHPIEVIVIDDEDPPPIRVKPPTPPPPRPAPRVLAYIVLDDDDDEPVASEAPSSKAP